MGFVGFRFDSGAGLQYGWARVRMMGLPENAFKVMDYAYADPGEPIRAGQTSSEVNEANTPGQGSLGLLALGAVGVTLWRRRRAGCAR
jgi:MYXO-CTERM domain-containing protein